MLKDNRSVARATRPAGAAIEAQARLLRFAATSRNYDARAARSRAAGLTQDAVAERMGATKSAVSGLESAGKHAPSLATLKRYASAVGCDL
ncbi:MAG: helix-turn-helix transcriptional regulator [Betaproteobacteria bacterium]|nr:helix-turn-helix transcriptional regulator [Betaproteobacteria bacterium]